MPAYAVRSMLHCCQPPELPEAAFHVPVVPVGVQEPAPARVVGRVVAEPVVQLLRPSGRAAGAGFLPGVPVRVGQRRPVARARAVRVERLGLDEHEVPIRLRVVRGPERQVAAGRASQVHRARQTLVRLIDVLRGHVPVARVRIERGITLGDPVSGLLGGELRIGLRLEDARGHQVRAGTDAVALLVARARRRVVQRKRQVLERRRQSDDVENAAGRVQPAPVSSDVRPQVVLEEVVRERGADATVGRGHVAVAGAERQPVLRVLDQVVLAAGMDSRERDGAALVDEVAHRHRGRGAPPRPPRRAATQHE